MFQRLRYFSSARDVMIFFQIIMVWSILPLLLLFPLDRVLYFLTPCLRNPSQTVSAQKIMRFANYWFSRRLIAYCNTCLKKSLVLYYMLNRYGTPVKICIGIKKEDGRLAGHSWIELDGNVIGEKQQVDDFVVMYTYPT